MKNYRILTILGTIIASLGTNWLPANADQTYNGASIYRDADNIYKVGLSPSSSVAVTYESAAISKTAYSDDCGVLKISLGATPPPTLSINGSAFTLSSAPELPNRAKYKCTGGVANYTGFTNSTGAFQAVSRSNGSAINTTLYISNSAIIGGKNKGSLITYAGSSKRSIKANACGFVLIKPRSQSLFTPTSSVNIDGSNLTFGNLPQNPSPPICLNDRTYSSSTSSISYNGANLYRTTKAIYYVGLAPNSLNAVEITGLASKDINPYKGEKGLTTFAPCGVFAIDLGKNNKVSSLKIGTMSYNVSSLAEYPALGCAAENLTAIAPNTLYYRYRPSNGTASSFVYRVTDTNKKKLTVEYPTTVSRNLPVNACGFAEIKSLDKVTGFNDTDKIKINGTEYTFASLPLAPVAPICKNGVTYKAN
jgi:hypothetical protein